MLPTFSTREQARKYDRARLRGLADQARGERGDLHRAYLDLLTALENLKCAGVKADFDDHARGFHDAISDRDAELCRDIDAAGDMYDSLDLSELEEFFIERRTA
jgi:uncharacterized protein YciI